MIKISIITPCWNAVRFIERTIQSVLSQTGDFELEYIIIDGVSTDGTLDIIRAYDSQVQWLSEPDSGQTSAINKGLQMSTGDVVAFLNADDIYMPKALQRVADEARSGSTQWMIGMCDIIDTNDREVRKLITSYKNYHLRRASYRRLLAENFISQPAVFWRRSLMNEVGYLDESEHYVMDYEYWLRLWQRYEPLIVDQHIASFRWYETSKSGGGFSKQFADELRVARKYAGSHRGTILLHKINYYKIVGMYSLMRLWRTLTPSS